MEKNGYPNIVSVSRREFAYDGEEKKCDCKKLAPRQTAWSDLNSGRRYYGCPDFLRGCKYFEWYDARIPDRAIDLLRKLRDNERFLAKENKSLRRQFRSCGSISAGESTNLNLDDNNSVQSDFKGKALTTVGDVVNENELRGKIKSLKEKTKSLRKEKEFYKGLLICALLCIACILSAMV
ncbi:hypothetical protein HRI_000724700 [Hibiscus trionum]|uniref:GRF-type domain-containing protein n=1 Tax=Hibiscus trionum TaxID=183268 RepID=A0A9W7H3T0_HIBTR|nr:hypothetical protein HRI_000724700 [Hibiscus trionum]